MMTHFKESNDKVKHRNDNIAKTDSDLPFIESDDAFAKKKPINLFLTLLLTVVGFFAAALVAKHYYKKINETERLRWESGRVQKAHQDQENARMYDVFQPLRNTWKTFIFLEVATAPVKTKPAKKGIIVKVINKGNKALKNVKLTAYHLNWNGEVSSIETLTLNNIKGNQYKALNLSSVKDPSKIKIDFHSIYAPSFNFCYNSEIVTEGKRDPYYCVNQP